MRIKGSDFRAFFTKSVNELHGAHVIDAGIQAHFTEKQNAFTGKRGFHAPDRVVDIRGGEQVFFKMKAILCYQEM